MTKFYAVKTNGEWEIWEKTQWQMKILTDDDPLLEKRMPNAPFNTRLEAERGIEDLRKRGL